MSSEGGPNKDSFARLCPLAMVRPGALQGPTVSAGEEREQEPDRVHFKGKAPDRGMLRQRFCRSTGPQITG